MIFEESTFLILCTAIISILAITAFLLRPRNDDHKRSSTMQRSNKSKSTASSMNTSLPYNPWKERQDRGVTISSNAERKMDYSQQQQEKPFQSRYYYAHNNPSATGGYKDGLRMEDYTMNQPRLLSRNGSQVVEEEEATASTRAESLSSSSSNIKILPKLPPTKYISRYLWDDPGKSNNMAYIRIEHLPATTGTGSISWKEWMAQQSTTTTTTTSPHIDIVLLEQRTLRVIVHSKDTNCLYELKLDPLYGPVQAVTAKTSDKRLTIQLHKLDNKAWPHPHQSKTKLN